MPHATGPDQHHGQSDRVQALCHGLGLRIMRRFASKKNRGYLVESGAAHYVLKVYSPEFEHHLPVEADLLKKAHNLALGVPRPVEVRDHALLMEYIEGDNLCDALNARPRLEYAAALAHWFFCFHEAFSVSPTCTVVRGDSNLRNFIVAATDAQAAGTRLVGVDFEESGKAHPASDIGTIVASVLNTDPMFTPTKAELCLNMIQTYLRTQAARVRHNGLRSLL